MAEQKPLKNPLQNAFVRAVLVAGGIFYTLTGVALLLTPLWFFNNIGNFPPFNRHYEGDLGTMLLPMGIAMMLAARNPAQHRLLFAVVVVGSVLHALNHLLDELVLSPSIAQPLTGSIPLAIFAVILVGAYLVGRPQSITP
jgi:hypothetical protein